MRTSISTTKPEKHSRKLIVIGDSTIGKTCLLTVFAKGYFPTTFVPTVFEREVVEMEVDGQEVELRLQDIGGQEYYDRLRMLDYMGVCAVLLAFAFDDKVSLDNLEHKWILEARQAIARYKLKNVALILVGCKKDLQDDPETIARLANYSMSPVSSGQAAAQASKLGVDHYLECSALRGEGVQEVFQTAIRTSFGLAQKSRKGLKSCNIM